MCYIYDVAVEDMGHYYLQITEVDDHTNIVHAKIDMNLFVKAAPRVTFEEEIPKALMSSNENHSFHCDVVSYPINDTKGPVTYDMKSAKFLAFVGALRSPLSLSRQATVDVIYDINI